MRASCASAGLAEKMALLLQPLLDFARGLTQFCVTFMKPPKEWSCGIFLVLGKVQVFYEQYGKVL